MVYISAECPNAEQMEELDNEPSDLFNVDMPTSPENPLRGFINSGDVLPVVNGDRIIVTATFVPPFFRLLYVSFTTVNVKRVRVTYITSNPRIVFIQQVSCFIGAFFLVIPAIILDLILNSL